MEVMKFLFFLFWIKQKRQNKGVLISKGKVAGKKTTLWLRWCHSDVGNWKIFSWHQSIRNFTIYIYIYIYIFIHVFSGWIFFWKYNDVIMTSWIVVQVWEVRIWWIWESFISGTITNSQTFLGNKSWKI